MKKLVHLALFCVAALAGAGTLLVAPGAHAANPCTVSEFQAAVAMGSHSECLGYSAPSVSVSELDEASQMELFAGRKHGRYQLDSGTRLQGWQVATDLYFGRSKGDVRGMALIWQPSGDRQVALSGSGLKLTRRLR